MTKLDFSQANVQSIGTAYTAMKTEVNTKTKQQLEAEDGIGQQSDASKLNSTSASKVASATDIRSIEDLRVSKDNNEATVLFADPTNGNLVKLNLSNENIDKLKKHFTGENNFFEKKDGSVRLNGEAEAFVSGWFGDIAYKREFLKADADRDGRLSEGEYENTRNGYAGMGEAKGIGNKVLSVIETVTETYTSPHSKRPKESESIESELNFSLESDIDIDGKLTDKEVLTGTGIDYRQLLIDNAKKHLGNIDDNRPNPFEDKTDAELELLLLQTRALQKLRASNGNENTLTAEEKKALGGELASLKKQFDKQEDLSSIKQELKEKIESTQFIDVRA